MEKQVKLFRHLPINDVLFLARKVDADFDEFPSVHLETSGVVLFVDLVEGGLCVLIHLELKEINVIVADYKQVHSRN